MGSGIYMLFACLPDGEGVFRARVSRPGKGLKPARGFSSGDAMVVGLVPPDEEQRIFRKLVDYYRQLYPAVEFTTTEATLTRDQLGAVYYTYAGEETEATAREKMQMINSAIGEGYSTPIVVLQKKKKMILLDGHRRVRVAYAQGMGWKALVIAPAKDIKFGIEDMILGKVKDLYGK